MKNSAIKNPVKKSIAVERSKKIKVEKYIDSESPIDDLPYPDYPFDDSETIPFDELDEASADETGFFRDNKVHFTN